MDYPVEQSAAALLDRASEMPMNEEQVEAFHHVLNLAQETDDQDTEFKARLFLATLSNINEDHGSMLTHFSAAVGMHDRDPVRFPGQGDQTYPDLFWLYKNALNLVISSVFFSREQIDNMLDQMEEHFTRAGFPRIAIDIERRDDALVNGSVERALELQELIDASPHDDPFDDCPTCQIAGKAALAIAANKFNEAQDLLYQIINIGPVGCVMEPETSLAAFMLRALKNGDAEFARFAQSTSAKANPEFQSLGAVGRHMEFLGVTGNHSRGLGFFTRYQHRLLNDPLATHGHFLFYLGGHTLLKATAKAGFGDLIVAGSGEIFGQEEDLSVDKLQVLCLDAARELAQKYDARNGNDNFSTRLQVSLENAELDIPLDIGGTNLLLEAQLATPSEPESVSEKLARFFLSNGQEAFNDARRFLLSAEEIEQLSGSERLSYALGLLSYPGSEQDGRELFSRELRAQGYAAADFLEAQDTARLITPVPMDCLTEAELLQEDTKSWIVLNQLAIDGYMSSQEEGSREKAMEIAARIIEHTAGSTEFEASHVQAQFSYFVAELATFPGKIDMTRYRELRPQGSLVQRIGLDFIVGRSAVVMDSTDGAAILDDVLGYLINAGMRETTAVSALSLVELFAMVGQADRATDMARLAVAELHAAGLPSRNAELMLGIQLASTQPLEARELLEKLLMPKFQAKEQFSLLEIQALLPLAMSISIHDPHTAAGVLLSARDMAANNGEFRLAIEAVSLMTEILYPRGVHEQLLEELNNALPIAQQVDDQHQSEMKILDSIAIIQADLGMTEALETLETSKELAQTNAQRLYVQESLNRAYFTFDRLEDCIEGCVEASTMAFDDGDPSNAAAQLEQGAQYAFQLNAVEKAVAMLERAFEVPEIPHEQALYYATNIMAIYEDLGDHRKAQLWTQKVEELENLN